MLTSHDRQGEEGLLRPRVDRLSDPIPVRLPPELLERVRKAAEDDDRSMSAWIRRAIEHALAN